MSSSFISFLMDKSGSIKKWIRNRRARRAMTIDNTKFLPEKINRVYHIHIRKSAGTSLNNLFLGQSNLTLKEQWREPLYIKEGKVYIQHHKPYFEAGNYFYGSSHYPLWELHLPANTFTYCILRDPLERLISLYKYYCWVSQVDAKEGYALDPSYFVLLKQHQLLNKSFKEFVNNLSPKYLVAQLYTFDKGLDPNHAFELLKTVNKVYFFENVDFAISDLTQTLKLKPLKPARERSFSKVDFTVNESDKEYAKELLKDEFIFYELAAEKYKIN